MEKQYTETSTVLVKISRIISVIFTPFVIPFGAFLVLFLFSYLRTLPFAYKFIVLGIVFCFTILMPVLTILLFQKLNRFPAGELSNRNRRYVPYLLTIIPYIFCFIMMYRLDLLRYMTNIILTALLIMVVSFITNVKWKLSEHMLGVGGIIGGLVSFSFIFGYNPVGWLCVFILIAGMLGTARIVLRHHSLGEVLFGFIVGFICAILVLHPETNHIFQFIYISNY